MRVSPQRDRRRWSLVAMVLALGCREAARAVDVDVDEAEHVARQTGEKVAAGLGEAREKVEAVGGDLRDAAREAGRSVSDAARAADDPTAHDGLAREAGDAIACASPERCTITAAYMERLRANPGFVTAQARVVPHRRDGRADGLEISGLEPLPQRLGFRSGDVIQSINGLSVHSLQSAAQLYLQLRSARRFTVVFARGDERHTFEIEVV